MRLRPAKGVPVGIRPARSVVSWVRGALGRGTYVRALEVGNGYVDSISRGMNWQLARVVQQIQADEKLARGFNMIGYSQGSLLARAYVQRFNAPRVSTLISWVGPQAGQFGVPDLEPILSQYSKLASPMWYAPAMQARRGAPPMA